MNKEQIIQYIGIVLKGELNDVMGDPRPLDWKKVEQRHKYIMNYLIENLK
jgi:hypothetical protein